jgi:hypothetical protein
MKRLMLAAAPLFLAFALAPAVAAAGDQDFTLRNRTGYTIDQVFVSAVDTDDWEEDVLGRDTLGDGEAWDIEFSRAEDACKFDLKVIYSDGEEAEWGNINLCATSEISLRYDHNSGRTWATTE